MQWYVQRYVSVWHAMIYEFHSGYSSHCCNNIFPCYIPIVAQDVLLVFAGHFFVDVRLPVSHMVVLGGLSVLFALDSALVLALERRSARAWGENQLLREQCAQAKDKLASTVDMLKFLSHEGIPFDLFTTRTNFFLMAF